MYRLIIFCKYIFIVRYHLYKFMFTSTTFVLLFFFFINYPLVEYCGIIHNILFPYFLFWWVLWSKILPNWTWIRVPKVKLPNVSIIVLRISKVKARVPKKEMHGIIITERFTCRKQFAWAIPFICTITTEHEHIFD